MKVLICGGGAVGRAIAERLADERNSVTMVDLSSDVLARLTGRPLVITLQGETLCGPCKNFKFGGLGRPTRPLPLAILALIVSLVSAPVMLEELHQRKQVLKKAAASPEERATIEIELRPVRL